jgi:hypothetical protein
MPMNHRAPTDVNAGLSDADVGHPNLDAGLSGAEVRHPDLHSNEPARLPRQ